MKIRSSVVACVVGVVAAVSAIARGDILGPNWNWSSFGTWGYGYSATFGQTFRGNGEAATGARITIPIKGYYSGVSATSLDVEYIKLE